MVYEKNLKLKRVLSFTKFQPLNVKKVYFRSTFSKNYQSSSRFEKFRRNNIFPKNFLFFIICIKNDTPQFLTHRCLRDYFLKGAQDVSFLTQCFFYIRYSNIRRSRARFYTRDFTRTRIYASIENNRIQ